MNSIIGFTALYNIQPDARARAITTQQHVASLFSHLQHTTVTVGASEIAVWGHGDLSERLHTLSDGSILVLIGSPQGEISWRELSQELLGPEAHTLKKPWDGRFVLLRVSADGRRWTTWNDWAGCIPVFHANIGGGRVASTLDPAVVAAARFSADAVFLPSLVTLLINGHCLSDWTLFRGMHVVPADSVAQWKEQGFNAKPVWTVRPSQEHWETAWDDLVDRMYELSRQAIGDALERTRALILPLSAGLDSRLIAAVCADLPVVARTYTWGPRDGVDGAYAAEIAKSLDMPWAHVDIGSDYLLRYTERWAALFGSSLHFHGMYQMAFLDAVAAKPPGPVVSGFLADVLTDVSLYTEGTPGRCQFGSEWYTHWTADQVEALVKVPVADAFAELRAELARRYDAMPGAHFQRAMLVEIHSRQRLFTSFQATLTDYWRGAVTPLMNRGYAQFCFSLPRAALDGRRLLRAVFRRYYPRLAAIPGTQGPEPMILTGRYLVKRRLAGLLPHALLLGPLRGFRAAPPRMDNASVQASAWRALWPIRDTWDRLSEWLDVSKVEEAYQALMSDRNDYRSLRKLQSVQAFAYGLTDDVKYN